MLMDKLCFRCETSIGNINAGLDSLQEEMQNLSESQAKLTSTGTVLFLKRLKFRDNISSIIYLIVLFEIIIKIPVATCGEDLIHLQVMLCIQLKHIHVNTH